MPIIVFMKPLAKSPKPAKAEKPKLVIVQDSREQLNWKFTGLEADVIIKKLDVGDYSIAGYEERFSVERKELNDFIQTLTVDHERFIAECDRAKKYDLFVIIVEGDYLDIAKHDYYSQVSPFAVMGAMAAITIDYGYPIIFCSNRTNAEKFAFRLMEKFVKRNGG